MRARLTPCLVILLAAAGCVAQRTALTDDEVARIAWYAEDVAHGLPRDPDELRLVEAVPATAAIARWATGTERDGVTVRHPAPLQARQQRWPLLRAGLASGVVRTQAEALLRLAEDASAEDRQLFADLLRQENLDRVATAAILLRRGDLPPASPDGRALVRALIEARAALDAAAGGRPWQTPETTP